MTITIDLNADIGEGDAHDEALLSAISSCNIACSGHAGDERSMRVTIQRAIANGVAIGAHPSYPDREGFGRRKNFMRGDDLYLSLLGQLEQFAAIAKELGTAVTHVKAHGALYNDAAGDDDLADTVAKAAATLPGSPALVGLPGSQLQNAAEKNGLRFIAEAFVDRAYLPDGRLMPRSGAGAVHTDIDVISEQAASLALHGQVRCSTGDTIKVRPDTLCIHGDTPGADAAVHAIRRALEQHGVEIRAFQR